MSEIFCTKVEFMSWSDLLAVRDPQKAEIDRLKLELGGKT